MNMAFRGKDINHKDKQYCDAVLRMTSKSMFYLLNSIPDAKGTAAYFYVLRCVVDSYLDKNLQPIERVKKSMVWRVFHEMLAPVDIDQFSLYTEQ